MKFDDAIFILDESSFTGKMIEKTLQNQNFSTRFFNNWNEALGIALDLNPKILILSSRFMNQMKEDFAFLDFIKRVDNLLVVNKDTESKLVCPGREKFILILEIPLNPEKILSSILSLNLN
jgi:hypothetical protein